MLRKALAIFFITVGICFLYGDDAQSHNQILKKIDAAITFEGQDLSAEYTITKRDPGGASSTIIATMFRRDATNQFLVLLLEPAIDKGKGYLKTGDTIWLYDPSNKAFTFTSAKERFQNSSFRNSDFNRANFSVDYAVEGSSTEQLGKFNCTVLNLSAIRDTASFSRVKLWISDDNLIRKMEDYSLSGQLLRTTAIPRYQRIGVKWVAAQMVILDHLKFKTVAGKPEYERTTITIRRPSLSALPDSVYTKEYLERVSR